MSAKHVWDQAGQKSGTAPVSAEILARCDSRADNYGTYKIWNSKAKKICQRADPRFFGGAANYREPTDAEEENKQPRQQESQGAGKSIKYQAERQHQKRDRNSEVYCQVSLIKFSGNELLTVFVSP